MNKTEAFRRLGFEIGNPMNQWTAENEKGVCITLWRKELSSRGGIACMDTRRDVRPISDWSPVGANLRRKHLAVARDRFDRRLSVVVLDGEPGVKVTNADPWFPPASNPDAHWRMTWFDEETGHFAVEIYPRKSAKPSA